MTEKEIERMRRLIEDIANKAIEIADLKRENARLRKLAHSRGCEATYERIEALEEGVRYWKSHYETLLSTLLTEGK